jgi:Uma2 family endonuclease
VTGSPKLTAKDLLRLPKPDPKVGKHYELVNGELIIVPTAGYLHELIKSRVLELLIAYQIKYESGEVFAEAQFPIADGSARVPEVAFVGNAKLAGVPVTDDPIPFVPDVAVEVVSDSETARDAEYKVQQYLASGVNEVWQIFPHERIVRIRTRDSIRDFQGSKSKAPRCRVSRPSPRNCSRLLRKIDHRVVMHLRNRELRRAGVHGEVN